MGDHKSEGLSWADQWDPEPLPAPGEKKGAHKDAGKGTAAKKFLTFQWVKKFAKRPDHHHHHNDNNDNNNNDSNNKDQSNQKTKELAGK